MVPFIGQSYQDRSNDVSSQRSINLYPEITEDANAKSKMTLVGTSGLKLYTDLSEITDGVARGMITIPYKQSAIDPITQRGFGVWGDKIVELIGEGSFLERGTISSGVTEVSMTTLVNFVVIADGVSIYVYDLEADTLTTATLPFSNPTKLVTLNNRIVAINSDDTIDEVRNFNKFYWSAINDPSDWDAIDWDSAQANSDPLISIEKRQGELWLFGPQSYEVWRITENADAPYARAGGSFTEIGCGALDSTASIADQIFWLGSSRAGENMVFMSNGYTAQRISTHAIEYQISKSGELTSDGTATVFQENGHIIYALSFNQIDQTWCYDTTTGEWHERTTRDPQTNKLHRWSPQFAIFDGRRILTGSSVGPYVLELDQDTFTEWTPIGEIPIQRIRQSPVYWDDLRLMFHSEFQIDMETGVGLQNGQGSDPKMAMQFSDNGGYDWSNEVEAKIGAIGAYNARVRFKRLGRSRKRVYRITITDPVKIVIIGARLIAKKGMRP